MIKKINDVLNHKEENYLLPLCWQHGDHTDDLISYVRRVYDSGCRAMCLESRPHPEFVRDGWWRDLDIILEEAKCLDMEIWIFDDQHCPTGRAAGAIRDKYPHLRQWELVERHIDAVGPMRAASVMTDDESEDHILIGAFAYKRHRDEKERCAFEAIDLTKNVKNGYLYWDIPEGTWRIFLYYKTREGGREGFLDPINPESVRVLIDEVYEPHYKHYSHYFKNTLVGFFTDEPLFGNGFRYGEFDMRPGKKGLPLPWSETVLEKMREKLGFDPIPHLNLLWFEDDANGDDQAEIRYAYMDTVTELYSLNFTKQLSDWCHEHGVMYIGHIIEEISLSCGAGHFFRAMKWQDMSGIDIVLHQLLPAMNDYYHNVADTAACWGSKFYHYVLAKLGASLAHIEPKMKGRAFCEVFGAYGWAEDTAIMKFLVDYLLVRGTNHFMPHAFDSFCPDPEFPPHFGFKDKDPSYDAIAALMRYTNKASHLLCQGTHVSGIGILYDEDLHWSCRDGKAMLLHNIAKELYDAHFDYDIIPYDYLDESKLKDGRLCLGDEYYDCLLVPHADHIAQVIQKKLKAMSDRGFKVYFINGAPENAEVELNSLALNDIVPQMKKLNIEHTEVDGGYERLRIYHSKSNDSDVYMFANEDTAKIDTWLTLSCSGKCVLLDLASDLAFSENVVDGRLKLSLSPRQSLIAVFTESADVEKAPSLEREETLAAKFTLELAETGKFEKFNTVGSYTEFFNVTGADFKPDFSGKMRYTFDVELKDTKAFKKIYLDLGEVGQNAELCINDNACGIRFAPPYLFDITKFAKDGTNTLCVTVGNTLVQSVRDKLSKKMVIAPSGLLGDVKVKYCN